MNNFYNLYNYQQLPQLPQLQQPLQPLQSLQPRQPLQLLQQQVIYLSIPLQYQRLWTHDKNESSFGARRRANVDGYDKWREDLAKADRVAKKSPSKRPILMRVETFIYYPGWKVDLRFGLVIKQL